MENKFIEAIKQLVTYGNREFLRSFRLRTEIKEEHNNNKETTTTDIASLSLSPPFQTIGFLESKWLEMIKELVDYGNKNLLGNFKLYLVMEERRQEGNNNKEVTNSILDIKKEERAQVHNPNNPQNNNHNSNSNNNNNHNQSWFMARDKSGRFISTSTKL